MLGIIYGCGVIWAGNCICIGVLTLVNDDGLLLFNVLELFNWIWVNDDKLVVGTVIKGYVFCVV